MTICRRNLRQINLNQWKDGKSRLHISATAVTDADELVNQYKNILHELIENHAPEVTRSVTVRSNAPWYISNLRLLKRDKRRCERKYLF